MSKKDGFSIDIDFNEKAFDKSLNKAMADGLKKVSFDFKCPTCQTKFSAKFGTNTCPECGQKIDLKPET